LGIMENSTSGLKVLVFFAHPDDETMFLGGTFAFLAAKGVEVHFICATRGEGGEMGDPPICSREDLGLIREGELRCAIETLHGASVQFAGYTDPIVGQEGELYPFTDDLETLAGYLKKEIQSIFRH
jgi:LmbE family N-acetylglucosaminyl deacetylase